MSENIERRTKLLDLTQEFINQVGQDFVVFAKPVTNEADILKHRDPSGVYLSVVKDSDIITINAKALPKKRQV